MAEELDWDLEDFDKAFAEIFQEGMAKVDFKARVMWIPNAIKHNRPESPNVVKSWGAEFEQIPECDLKQEALDMLRASVYALGEAFAKSFEETFGKLLTKASSKTLGNQEQEQEQNQEQEQEQEQEKEVQEDCPPPGSPPTATTSKDIQLVLDNYHRILPRCQRIAVLNDKRRKRIQAAIKLAKQVCHHQDWIYDAERFWAAYFEDCATDPWLRGEIPNPKNPNWKQNLDVLLAEDRFASVMDRAIEAMQLDTEREPNPHSRANGKTPDWLVGAI